MGPPGKPGMPGQIGPKGTKNIVMATKVISCIGKYGGIRTKVTSCEMNITFPVFCLTRSQLLVRAC